MSLQELAEKVLKHIKKGRYVIAFTGAGISRESGIPTFRGKDGLWSKYDPEELASPCGFAKDPELVWKWYSWRMELIAKARPNLAHIALAKLEDMGLLRLIITQNVDGLHQRAGSKRVLELHGNIWRTKCTKCSYKGVLYEPPTAMPTCPECGSLLRPDVVWFGEPLPQGVWQEAVFQAINSDLLLVIGTSGVVAPASFIPKFAYDKGSMIVEINPNETPISGLADLRVRAKAGEFFSFVLKRVKGT
jgi:NAD-dependent deacetylase